MSFFRLLNHAKKETGSIICVGLDLAAFGSRRENTLKKDEKKVLVILDLINTLSPFCCAFKVNRQYILDLSLSDIQRITMRAHEYKRPVIVDHKISDIGSSNDQALLHFKQEGFDAFTASPFPGNIKEICVKGHSHELASFILVLMSNPEAEWMKESLINDIPLYQHFSRLANEYADGIVVGTTGHIKEEDLKSIIEEISGKIILSPGIGTQGGEMKKIMEVFRNDVIFNVGRAIIYNKNPLNVLKQYNDNIQLIQKTLGILKCY